jgi:transcriptional regulator with XRE-family HTH domain
MSIVKIAINNKGGDNLDKKKKFSANLSYMRQREGMTQAELAERIGISQTILSQYELGKRNPSADVHARLAEALGVTMDDLMYGEVKGVKSNVGTAHNQKSNNV